ncbi:MAG TPA: hypothetical protein VII82_04775, partial [Polyangiaceae bacterium]
MKTVFSGVALTAVLSLGASVRGTGPAAAPRTAATRERISPLEAACPRGTLPDGDACVRLPSASDDDDRGQPEAESSSNSHRDRLGRWVVYDEIPRRPDRPADYDAYRYPVPCEPGSSWPCVVSGYDL